MPMPQNGCRQHISPIFRNNICTKGVATGRQHTSVVGAATDIERKSRCRSYMRDSMGEVVDICPCGNPGDVWWVVPFWVASHQPTISAITLISPLAIAIALHSAQVSQTLIYTRLGPPLTTSRSRKGWCMEERKIEHSGNNRRRSVILLAA